MKQVGRAAVVFGLIIVLAGSTLNAQVFRPGREMGKGRKSGGAMEREKRGEDEGNGGRELPMPPEVTTSHFSRTLMDANKDSPFGFFGANMLRYKHNAWYDDYGTAMNDMGAYWVCFGATFSFRWNLMQNKNPDGSYTEPYWDRHDRMVKSAQAYNIHIIGMFRASEPTAGEWGGRVTPAVPNDMAGYKKFIKKVVERYNGDGKDDMPGLEYPIKYWLIEDEPMSPKYFNGNSSDYAVLLSAAYEAVKSADADANVICAMVRQTGLMGKEDPREFMEDFFKKLAEMGKNRPYDIIDQHWIGAQESLDEYSFCKELLGDIEKTAGKYGFSPAPFFSTEIAGFHTPEQIHAADLLRRYAILLSLGVKKILWSGIKAAPDEGLGKRQLNNYFRQVTVIRGDGVKKPAYWTYKLMVEMLDGSDWEKTQVNKTGDGVYIFTFMKKGFPVWVACNNAGEAKVRIAAGKDIKVAVVMETIPDVNKGGPGGADYLNLFRRTEAAVKDGVLEITVGETPLIITGQ